MRHDIVLQIVDFLFGDLQPPLCVLGQEHCSTYKDHAGVELKSPDNARSPLFQKNMAHTFWWPPRKFADGALHSSMHNTILIDDSPYKSAANPDSNAIFPYPKLCPTSPSTLTSARLYSLFSTTSSILPCRTYAIMSFSIGLVSNIYNMQTPPSASSGECHPP